MNHANEEQLKDVLDILNQPATFDWWEEVPSETRQEIEMAILQADSIMVIPNEVIEEKMAKWLSK